MLADRPTVDAAGAAKIVKTTKLGAPLNGGVNSQTGDMILLFDGESECQHRLELPFDQSGPALEILERAATAAAEWAETRAQNADKDGITPMDLRPRETEFVMLGEDAESRRPLLVVRLAGGHQFSFLLDQKIVEQLRVREQSPAQAPISGDPWVTVAEDIEWLSKEWCTLYQPPSNAELRRGSAVLRRLLVENALGHAWREFGFEKQPRVSGPDVMALLSHHGTEPRHVVSFVAGGATVNGIQMAMLGCARAFNESTGILTADEAYSGLRPQILILIAGMVVIGIAMDKSGLAALSSDLLINSVDGLSPLIALIALYLLTSVITEILSSATVAVLMTPVAVALAESMAVSPRPFLVAVMMAASASFATPFGYQTNVIVYQMGGYRYMDFIRIGMPMNMLAFVVSIVAIRFAFPF